jgi:predicted subunit of tRNA(5-methylaminomethyl-2-thiouridylate) methyltransferase
MNQTSKQFRILAVSLSSRGFGYAVMEGDNALILYGKMIINKSKNARSLAHIEKMFVRNKPDVLVLQDVDAKGTRRDPRIKNLHRKAVALAKKRKIKVVKISGTKLRSALLGNPKGTKQEMAESLAKQFPDELALRLPMKRKAWTSEDARMDIFDAVGLVVVFRMRANQIGIR